MTSLAAPRGGGSAPPDRPDGAALSELEPGELLCQYDAASRALPSHAGPGDEDFEAWLKLHGEIMTRLARDWAR